MVGYTAIRVKRPYRSGTLQKWSFQIPEFTILIFDPNEMGNKGNEHHQNLELEHTRKKSEKHTSTVCLPELFHLPIWNGTCWPVLWGRPYTQISSRYRTSGDRHPVRFLWRRWRDSRGTQMYWDILVSTVKRSQLTPLSWSMLRLITYLLVRTAVNGRIIENLVFVPIHVNGERAASQDALNQEWDIGIWEQRHGGRKGCLLLETIERWRGRIVRTSYKHRTGFYTANLSCSCPDITWFTLFLRETWRTSQKRRCISWPGHCLTKGQQTKQTE